MKREKGKMKCEVCGVFPKQFQKFSELFGLQWCLKYSLSHYGKDEKLISSKLQILHISTTANCRKERQAQELPDQTGSSSQRAHGSSLATPRAESVLRTTRRINTSSASERNQSKSQRIKTWSQTSVIQINQVEDQAGSGQRLDK